MPSNNVPMPQRDRFDRHEVVIVGERGLIEIFKAPFTKPPLRIRTYGAFGLALAPNGDLFESSLQGFKVYHPPYTGQPRFVFKETAFGARGLLFGSKGLLFAFDSNGTAQVFKPPYSNGPSVTFQTQTELQGMAIDSKNNVFLVGGGTPAGGGTLFECAAPVYSSCSSFYYTTKWRFADGAIAIDKRNNIYTGVGLIFPSMTFGKLAPPYTKIAQSVNLDFWLTEVVVTPSGSIVVEGADGYGHSHINVYPSKITDRPVHIKWPIAPSTIFGADARGNLFIASGTYAQPCLWLYPYPYSKAGPCLHLFTAAYYILVGNE